MLTQSCNRDQLKISQLCGWLGLLHREHISHVGHGRNRQCVMSPHIWGSWQSNFTKNLMGRAFYRMGFKWHCSNQQHEQPEEPALLYNCFTKHKHAWVTKGVQQILHTAPHSGFWPSTQVGIFSQIISHRFLRVVSVWPELGLLWLQGN